MLAALRSRPLRVLLVLATLLCAVAVATGSGATYRSSSASTVGSLVSGTLLQTNSKTGAAVLSASGMRPGSSVTGSVTITNTGTLPGTFTLGEANATNGFATGSLTIEVVDQASSAVVYRGDVGGLTTRTVAALAPGASRTFVLTATLSASAPAADQGKSARADYVWSSVPTATG